MITILRRLVVRHILIAALKVKVTAWPCSKIESGLNFIICSQITQLFYRNDHHIETMCCEQHLGRYLEGQGHSITLQQYRVRSITLLFEVGFKIISQKWSPYWDNVSCNIWVATLKVKVTAWPWRPITSLFEVWFYNFFTEMNTILRRCVARNIWVATLKVKITAWHCSKIVCGR
jgi:hypothetical protein